MAEIKLKKTNRITSVSRSEVKKAVQEVFSMIREGKHAEDPVSASAVVITNRIPSKGNKK